MYMKLIKCKMVSTINKGQFFRFHVAGEALDELEGYLTNEEGFELVEAYQRTMIIEPRLPLDDLLAT